MTQLAQAIDYYQKNRTSVNGKCMQRIQNEMKFCSKLIFVENENEISTDIFCSAYVNPDSKWKIGDCPLADDFLKSSYVEPKDKVRIGQQKQRKK